MNKKILIGIFISLFSLMNNSTVFCAAEKVKSKSAFQELVQQTAKCTTQMNSLQSKKPEDLTVADCKLFIGLYNRTLAVASSFQAKKNAEYKTMLQKPNIYALERDMLNVSIGKTFLDFKQYLDYQFSSLHAHYKAQENAANKPNEQTAAGKTSAK